MKDFGQVDTILGINVKQKSESFELGQPHNVEKVLDKFKYLKIQRSEYPI